MCRPGAASSTPRHALREPCWVRPPRHRGTRSMEPSLGALCRAPHLDAKALCTPSRRNGPLPHAPTQRPTAPHPGATAPCSTPRSNSPCSTLRSKSTLPALSEQQPPAPHFRSKSTLLRISEHGIGRQTMPRNGRNGPQSPGTARLPRVSPDAKRPHDQTARGHTRNARTTKRPAATRDTPPTANGQRPVGQRPTGQRQRVRRQTDHQFGRQLPSARPAAARSGLRAPPGQPATAAGSASDRRRVSQ